MDKDKRNKINEDGSSAFEKKIGHEEIVSFTRKEIMEARGWSDKKGKKK